MHKTAQEEFWAGEFGIAYTARNANVPLPGNLALFTKILSMAPGITSIIEFGTNKGPNLLALKTLLPNASLTGVEINPIAAAEARKIDGVTIIEGSALEYQASRVFDMVLCKGVLCHLDPTALPNFYRTMYESSARYICIADYYNPTPVEVVYRGHKNRLTKRDFAGEMLDSFQLRLVDYGFVYHRDPFPQDDANWFLMEK